MTISEALAEKVARFEERSSKREDETAARLKLPTLLEARRREHNIPEAAFRQEALFDRILVWQLDAFKETYGDSGLIHKHVNVKDREREEAPRGVIVSSGLHALDVMWGHGIELGHIVSFVHLAPYRLPLDDHDANALIILRDGDLIASEDVRELVRTGVLRVEHHVVEGKKQHVYFDTRTNSIRVPWAPAIDNQL